tara:strand:- start:272 stop:448 length:177 start_codon:yes stop_codon:yes gene_type:complete
MGNKYDWRKTKKKKSFPYKGINDPKYLKDRAELFAKSGNGWWWWQGTLLGKNIGKDYE